MSINSGIALAAYAKENVSITIGGVGDSLLENILTSLSLERQKDNPRLTESSIKKLHKEAEREIKIALQALGYYKPTIRSELNKVEGIWQAHYEIDAGAPLTVGTLDLQFFGDANNDQAFEKLRAKFPIQSGDVMHHGLYEKSKKDIQRLAASRGYFDATFSENKVEVDLEKNTAKVTLHFNSKNRYSFGEVRYSKSPISYATLLKLQSFEEGQPYENSLLVKLQQSLSNTDYFEDVEVRPKQELISKNSVPVQVKLTPKKRNRYTAGVGFGTDTGPRIKFGWKSRYINEYGHRASADIKLSPVLSTMTTNYTLPHFPKKGVELDFGGGLSREDTDTSRSDTLNLAVNYRQKRWGWDEAINISYLIENFEIGRTERSSQLLLPGITWSMTETDSPTYTKNGFHVDLNIRGASENILSDVTLIQASLNGKYIRSFWKNGRVIVRGNIGATSVSDFDKMPTSLRYFAGGDNSIRGFDYEDLGPRDSNGDIVGGKYLAVGSFEYEHRIKEKWALAGFVDAGNSFNDFDDEIEYGVGFGVRWFSPVGLVRVDLASGISDPDKPVRLHIRIGPDL
ncbi:MAG: autotransporter assembly complex family protein [Gammaproteobacteria bacterium]